MIATLLTIVFLIAMWVAVLAAPVLRNRSAAGNRPGVRGGDSIKTFQRQLATLERATPYRSPVNRSDRSAVARSTTSPRLRPPSPGGRPGGPVGRRPLTPTQRSAQRRRQVLGGLIAAVVVTLGLALVAGGWFILAHLLADGLLVGYVALLLRTLRLAAEREMKVAFLPHRAAGAEPTTLLAQVARRNHG